MAKRKRAFRTEVRERREKHESRFPLFAAILLLIGIVWFFNDMNILSINVPWIPLVIIVIAISIMINRHQRFR